MTTPILTTSRTSFSSRTESVLTKLMDGPAGLWVTDADRTLWSDDIGEAFLRTLQDDGALVASDAQGDAWTTYVRKVQEDESRGYAWAAQAMAGLLETDVQARAERFARGFVGTHGFGPFRRLVRNLLERDWEIWVVSASNQWIVEAGARLMGIPPENVVGIRVEVENGRLTDRLVSPLPNRAGKVAAIETCIGRRPTLVTGDSRGDLEMLALAEGLAMVITTSLPRDPGFLVHAESNGWFVEVL